MSFRVSFLALSSLNQQEKKLALALQKERLFFVPNPMFELPDAGEIMLKSVTDVGPPIKFPEGIFLKIGPETESVDPLTPEQEELLFLQYNYCRFRCCSLISAFGETEVNNIETIKAILQWYSKYIDLQETLVRANILLIMAYKRIKNIKIIRKDFPEFVSRCEETVLNSVRNFDVSRGFKFSTYVFAGLKRTLIKIGRAKDRWLKRMPPECQFDPAAQKSDYIRRKREEKDREMHETELEELKAILASDKLTDLHKKIIELRFGVGGHNGFSQPVSLVEAGKLLGMTGEGVRQHEERVKIKLKKLLKVRMKTRFFDT